MSEMMIKNSLVKIKETPPYSPELEAPVLLNSLARASLDIKTGSYMYKAKLASEIPIDIANVATISDSLTVPSGASGVIGVGVNQGMFIPLFLSTSV
jgi:fatty acid synthase subunit beta